jgi:putative phage-type endonuclease
MTKPLSKEQWLKERTKGIGGSDIAAIMGVSRYSTPLDVYLSKVEDVSIPDNFNMAAGRALEPVIAEWYCKDNHFTEIKPEKEIYIDKTRPFFLGSVDRFFVPYKADPANYNKAHRQLMEIKNTSRFVDGADPSHFCQMQWYLSVTDTEMGVIVYNNMYNQFEAFSYSKNHDYILEMREKAEKFWRDHVMTKTPPEPTCEEDVMKLYPTHEPATKKEADREIYEAWQKLKNLKEEIKNLDGSKKELEGKLKVAIGPAEELFYGDIKLATFKTSERVSVDGKLLKAERPDIFDKYSSISQTRKLLIK